jgi:hypothetical protein
MIRVLFNARRANQSLDRNLEVFMDRTASTLLLNLKKYTPKRSGLAARSWYKRKDQKHNYTLFNNQNYVARLDKGYSRQAKDGFYKPASRDTTRTNNGRFFK